MFSKKHQNNFFHGLKKFKCKIIPLIFHRLYRSYQESYDIFEYLSTLKKGQNFAIKNKIFSYINKTPANIQRTSIEIAVRMPKKIAKPPNKTVPILIIHCKNMGNESRPACFITVADSI